MKKNLLLALLICMALPATALDPLRAYRVQPPKGCVDKDVTKDELALPDLIQIGVCTNPSLSAQYMGVKSTEATLGTARSEYLPSIVLTGNANIAGERVEHGNYTQTEPYSGKVQASWLLFDFGGRSARTTATREYLQAANFNYNAYLQKLILSVQTAYLNLLAAKESLTSAKATSETYKQSYNEAQKRYKLGMVSLSDNLQAKTQYEQALLAVVQAENSVQQFLGALAVLINLTPNTQLKVEQPNFDKQYTQIETDDIHKLFEEALANRPEIHAQQSAERAAKANLKNAKAKMLPSISAVAAAAYNDNWKHSALYKTDNSAGLTLSWPLFTGFADSYAKEAASYAYEQEQQNTRNIELQVQNEVWSSYQHYKTALRSYEISQTVLESAEENERVAFRYYKVGKGDILNLLTAVAQLADARQNKITAFYNLLLSKANLYRSIGKY